MRSLKNKLFAFFAVIGPGIIVMLADTDVGSLVTAAQSGAIGGYKLLIVQLLLIPVLYVIQELTVRLGIVTKKGQGELIKKHFGNFWAFVSTGALVFCCVGAIITEMSGIASVGILFGVPTWFSMLLTVIFLAWLVWTKSYHSVERIALAIGSFALIYLFVAFKAHPSLREMLYAFSNFHYSDVNFSYLIAANIGAVIMPWMIFYQQSAIVDKKLKLEHLGSARLETFLGAIITQVIMISVLIAVAATIGKTNPGAPLNTVEQISDAIVPYLGINYGRVLFGLGMLGSALIATVVVSLAAAWSIGEIIGFKRSLQDHPKEAPWFYGIYLVILLLGAIVVTFTVQLVRLNVAIEVMNALFLPIVLTFLFLLARKALSDHHKLQGWYAWLVGAVLFLTSIFGLGSGIWGIMG